jgi:hypothetical protein
VRSKESATSPIHIESGLRVEKASGGTSVLCPLCLKSGNVVTLSSDTGNDRDGVVDSLDESLDDIDLLLFGEEGTFTGVTKDDESLYTLNGSEPRSNSLDSLVVDGAVFVEGSDLVVSALQTNEGVKTHRSRSDTSHVEADTTSGVGEG